MTSILTAALGLVIGFLMGLAKGYRDGSAQGFEDGQIAMADAMDPHTNRGVKP